MAKTSTQADAYGFAGLAAVAGGVLLIAGLTRSSANPNPTGGVPTVCALKPGETLSGPSVSVSPQTMHLAGLTALTVTPQASYSGPGRNTYTYASLRQSIGGSVVTVYASGIGNVHLPQAGSPTAFPLVPSTEPQPCGNPAGPVLTLFPWTANSVTPCGSPLQPPVCGAPPRPGPADLYVEIYEDQMSSGHLVDAVTGDASPSCSCVSDVAGTPCRMRCPVARTIYPGVITFQ